MPRPPRPRREPVVHELHGRRRVEQHGWLTRPGEPEVTAHLQSERDFYDASTDHLAHLRDELFTEMSGRVPRADSSVNWRCGGHVYWTETPVGNDYTHLLRRDLRSAPGARESVLDEQAVARARVGDFLSVGGRLPSPDGRLLAWSVDVTGEELHELRFRDVAAGTDLPDVVPRTCGGGGWSADSLSFTYPVPDAQYRPYQVWRHRLGTPATEDVLVLTEDDRAFELDVAVSRSGDWLVLTAADRDTTETWVQPAGSAAPPVVLLPRRRGVTSRVDHLPGTTPGDPGRWLVVTDDGAPESRVLTVPVGPVPADLAGPDAVELVPGRPDERVVAAHALRRHVVVEVHRGAQPVVRVLPRSGGVAVEIAPDGPAGSLRLGRLADVDVEALAVATESLVRPPTWWSVDLDTGARTRLRDDDAPGHDPARYREERLAVVSADGTEVPVTLVRHRDTALDGTAPCLLWGYGAYEACSWPEWDPALPSLLDRGVVFALAHVRGGGEGGRRWWTDGRLAAKQHTFDDHLAVADALAGDAEWVRDGVRGRAALVDGARLGTRGLSAGGLLQGAVFSQRPARWRAVVAEVPFVDVVTTMLDPSIPLTVNEWDEWGDPRRAADFGWMLAYSPMDQLPPAGGRPDLLVTGAVHDPRVLVHEPARWVAALRDSDPDWAPRCLFRVETGASAHVGPSGRYGPLHYEAEIAAWLLHTLGVGS